jgi:alpha-galactosidase
VITFDAAHGIWTIRNERYVYAIGLKDGKCHHIAFLPVEYEGKIEYGWTLAKALRPEAHVNVGFEGAKWFSSGVRSIGRGASLRAEYVNHEVSAGKGCESLVISSRDEETGLEIKNVYVCHEDSAAVKRYVIVKNLSERVLTVDHLSSFVLYGLPWEVNEAFQKDVHLVTFPAGWAWEGRMAKMTLEQAGVFSRMSRGSWHIESTGSVSCRDYLPFFVIECEPLDLRYVLQIEHSASWRFEVGGLDNENGFFVQGGMGNYSYAHWAKDLLPGESFRSIEASISCTRGSMDDALNAMHKHQVHHIMRKASADRELPVVFNEWQSTRGAVNINTIANHLRVLGGTGIDVYVIDAGWYLAQYNDVETHRWFSHVGDWIVDGGRFPAGIGQAAEMITRAGMIPGIWLEIEAVAVNANAYREKWNLLMKNGSGFVEDECRRFLYFGYKETRDHATGVFEGLIAQGFRYFKIDYNVDCGLGCTNSGESLGQGLVDHINGYYAWLDELRCNHPDIIIESCAGGGLRLDYGMLCRSDLVSVTDQDDWRRLSSVFHGVSKAIHPSQMGIWSIVKSGFNTREATCALANSMMARMHISGDVENFTSSQKSLLTESVSFYKKWRDVVRDPTTFYHTPAVSFERPEGWLVVQMNNRDDSRILLGAWRLRDGRSSLDIGLKHVSLDSQYRIETFPGTAVHAVSGDTLSRSFRVSLDAEFSAIIFGIERV